MGIEVAEGRHAAGVPGPLGDDWLNWDPADIQNYPAGAPSPESETELTEDDAWFVGMNDLVQEAAKTVPAGALGTVCPTCRGAGNTRLYRCVSRRVWLRKNNKLHGR